MLSPCFYLLSSHPLLAAPQSEPFSPCRLSLGLCPSQLGLSQWASGWLHGICPSIFKLVFQISDPQKFVQCVWGVGGWGGARGVEG